MKAFVTGGTGFVGAAVVRQLLGANHEVTCLVRERSRRENIDGLPLRVVDGDLRDQTSLNDGMRGCDTVFHVAADYRLWCPDPREIYAVNVDGTRALMQAALDQGIRRVVYTSSVATLGLHPDGTPADEQTPSTLDDMIGNYKRSKFLAERVVTEFVNQESLPAVIVNPSTPVGPRDLRPTPTGKMIRDAALGRIPAYVDTGLNIVHVDDVAAGHLLALEHGKLGERYILGGENLSLRQILECIARLSGRKPPRVRLPRAAVLPIAHVSQWWARLTGGPEPSATVEGVRMSRKRMYFTSEKAERELGYHHRPAEAALRDAVEWFLERVD